MNLLAWFKQLSYIYEAVQTDILYLIFIFFILYIEERVGFLLTESSDKSL